EPAPKGLEALPPEQALRSVQKHLDILPAYLSPRMVLDHLFLELREGLQKGEVPSFSFTDELSQI
ncbi:MAG TPA: hypothetical protein VFR02_07630, partial [bacterium]|nr:hypothetical protein [bacterium]